MELMLSPESENNIYIPFSVITADSCMYNIADYV